ncbi:M4 family metallopeptidase [Streptomyces sp. AV19]|uniref:M4 family metallopeptidase n=1 Tax=Streptomyces sp. AV19 TaxID=2793068 RepID=UPI0018FE0C6D|nr:M4 family metallopeptidase [Streptomyces sp. AV19]MBH1933656.1 M4 family metallopeptidase [Streptomyces sp. AV19]MDG4535837.1 M4 family metallopeptidase [Streptomyces sp. AV19]
MGAAALVVSAVPAQAADPAPGSGPGQVIPGLKTATPAMVTGIREPAKADGSAADAARGHLAAKEDRYRIADPGRDLKPLRTVNSGTTETVRLQQKHKGVEVLGGQYVVRMEHKNGKRVVTGTSGKYFTGLTTGTAPEVDEELAVDRAVEATATALGARRAGVRAPDEDAAYPLTGTARGLVVLPKGQGVLTQHVTVRGSDPATKRPVLHEVYIDARSGHPVLQYSGIKTFGGPKTSKTPDTSNTRKSAKAADEPAEQPTVNGSGARLNGKNVDLQLSFDEQRKEYLMRDRSRMRDSSKKDIATYDGRKLSVGDVSGTWPDGIKEFGSQTPAFGKEATEAGAVDAHWAAGKVYDYYRTAHGRNSLNGRGGQIDSIVGVSFYGLPYVNAFWDGTKMVYGNGDQEYRPMSSGLDVVGHEMTHGVVENSANLVYAGQSGAMNEAIADYFGNAIKTDTLGIPMDSPDSGLLGDTLCRTKSPRECAFRDLNDGRTTSKSFLGVAFGTDNGGVHLNSTIFSGALWDIRKDVGRTLADKVVYKALTEYITPLDGFTEGRDAVLAAARDLKLDAGQLRAVERSFNAHGVVPGWELALGVDSDQLLGKVNTDQTAVGAGGGWWAASKSNDDGTEAYSVWAGRVDGSGSQKLISPNDGRYHINPVTDGKTVVWVAYKARNVEVLARSLAGGPIRKLYSNRYGYASLAVEGKTVVFQANGRRGSSRVHYVKLGETDAVRIDPGPGRYASTNHPSLSNGRIAFVNEYRENGKAKQTVELLDAATGRRSVVQDVNPDQLLGQTAVTSQHVYWLAAQDAGAAETAVRRVNLDGTGAIDVSPAKGKDALSGISLSASENAVTVTAQTADTEYRNETLAKLWQFTPDGKHRARVSCNRGEQLWGAAESGTRVVWLDATTGYTDLVTRHRPAGNCG